MKVTAITILSILTFSGSSFAADIIDFPAKNGMVVFHHKKHQETVKDCKLCHENALGKIKGFDKEHAHKLCKGCHEKKKVGPTQCGECHKASTGGRFRGTLNGSFR